jgi:hypothetical protein
MIEELKQYLSESKPSEKHLNNGVVKLIELENIAKIFFIVYSDMVDVTYIDSISTEISLDDYCEAESVIYEWLNENKPTS